MKTIITTMMIMIATSTQAQQVKVKYVDNIKTIHFDGYISENSDKKLESVIKAHPDIEWVTFNSIGGDLAAGNRINLMLDNYIMSAAVLKDDECISACANAFIGGERLSLEGKLEFHSYHKERYEGDGRIRVSKTDLRDDLYEAQITTSLQIYYLLTSGFSWDLHFEYVNKKGEFIKLYNNNQLKRYYIGDINFTKEFQNGKSKKFVEFSKISKTRKDTAINKNVNTIKLSNECLKSNTVYQGRVRFISIGVKTFYQTKAGSGRTKRIKVKKNQTWLTGNFEKGHVFLHSTDAKEKTYGWVKHDDIEKVCE